MDLVSDSYMSNDPRLIDQIVYELKSQGIFDQFRKECIADVDTKPAYQNLRQRVEGSVNNFLMQQKFSGDMNKNQMREQLRKNISESGFLEFGVERIVDQVVNPKISTVFLPKVEDVVYRFLGLERPNRDCKKPLKIDVTDLLPNDLEAVSPESEHDQSVIPTITKKEEVEVNENSVNSSNTRTEDESPPFELLEETTKFSVQEDNSVDSQLSGHPSSLGVQNTEIKDANRFEPTLEISQSSKNSFESHLSTETSEDNSKMEICEDTAAEDTKPIEFAEELKSKSSPNEIEKKLESKTESDSKTESKKGDAKRSHEKHKSRSDRDKKDDKNKKSQSKYDTKVKDHKEHKSSPRHSSSSSRDKEKDKKENRNGKDETDKTKSKESDRSKDRRKSKDAGSEKADVDKDKNKSKSDNNKSKHSLSSSIKNSKTSSSVKRDSSKDKDRSEDSTSKHKDSSKYKESSKSKDKEKSRSSHSSKDRKSDQKSRPDKDKYKKDDKNKSYDKKSSSKRDKDKKPVDDHYSSKDKRSDRRSTDRDSNDGSGKTSRQNSFTDGVASLGKSKEKESSEVFTTGCGDSTNSDNTEATTVDRPLGGSDDSNVPEEVPQSIKYIKPKFASNIQEAMKIMKIRKQLAKLEKINQLSLSNFQAKVVVEKEERKNETESKENSIQLEQNPENTETPLLQSKELSMETFEALEARLAQEMSNISHNMYGEEDDNFECSSITISPIKKINSQNDKTFEFKNCNNTIKSQNESKSISIDKNQSLGEASKEKQTVLKETTIVENGKESMEGGNEGGNLISKIHRGFTDKVKDVTYTQDSICISKDDTRKVMEWEDEDTPCYYFKNNSTFNSCISKLNAAIRKLELTIEKRSLEIHNNIPTFKQRGQKRKIENNENNNKLASDCLDSNKHSTNGKGGQKEALYNAGITLILDVSQNQNFSLPLSPAESDKSGEHKREEPVTPKIKKTNRASVGRANERYSNEDLYKPRPVFNYTSSRRRGKTE